jgi:hypothetical protein
VAHKNTYVLKTYDFSKLNFLNLKINKQFGLELIARVNFQVKHINDGKDLEFSIGEQEKQMMEYLAMLEVDTLTDYSKMLTYIGAREAMTNSWAIQRLFPFNIQTTNVKSCGNFLSFREQNGNIMASSAIKELEDYDVFMNHYIPAIESLIEASSRHELLGDAQSATKIAEDLLFNVKSLNHFLTKEVQYDEYTVGLPPSQLKEDAKLIAEILLQSEKESWYEFANIHFSTIFMPQDGVQDLGKIIERVTTEAIRKRKEAVLNSMLGQIAFTKDQILADVEQKLTEHLKIREPIFKSLLETELRKTLVDYSDKTKRARINKKNKEDELFEVVQATIKAAHIKAAIKRRSGLEETLYPVSPEEMQEVFHYVIGETYNDVNVTLVNNRNLKILFDKYMENVNKRFYDLVFEKSKETKEFNEEMLAKLLWDAVFFEANLVKQEYPYTFEDELMEDMLKKSISIQDNLSPEKYMTHQFIPVFEPAPLFVEKQEETPAREKYLSPKVNFTTPSNYFDRDYYIQQNVAIQDNTSREKVMGYNYQPYVDANFLKRDLPIKKEEKPNSYNYGYSFPGHNADKQATGQYSTPLKITPKGDVVSSNGKIRYGNADIYETLKQQNVFTPKALNYFEKKKNEHPNYKMVHVNDLKNVITDPRIFFSRVFTALGLYAQKKSKNNLQDGNYFTNSTMSKYSLFGGNLKAQEFLADKYLAKAYQIAPLLRNEVNPDLDDDTTVLEKIGAEAYVKLSKVTQKKLNTNTSADLNFPGYKFVDPAPRDNTRVVMPNFQISNIAEPISFKIAPTAIKNTHDPMVLDSIIAMKYIKQAIETARINMADKLPMYCYANYKNAKKDAYFKKMFNSSKYLRASLMTPGMPESSLENMQKFDNELRKEFRSNWEKFNEDYLEPALMALMAVALIAFAIVLTVGTFGTGSPVAIGMVGIASTILSVEFFVSTVVITASAYARYQVNFYEVPAQLKFQKTLAVSQIDQSKLVDWDFLREEVVDNKQMKKSWYTRTAIDALFVAFFVHHLRQVTGVAGVKAFRRQTGLPLKMWSKPPKNMLINRKFSELRNEYGFIRAVGKKTVDITHNVRMYQPKYQALLPHVLDTAPLRSGLVIKAMAKGLADDLGWIEKAVAEYVKQQKGRLTTYTKYVAEHNQLVQKVRLNGNLTGKELMEHGKTYSKFSYMPRSLSKAVKEGRFKEWLEQLNNGKLYEEMNTFRSELVTGKISRAEDLVELIKDLKLNGDVISRSTLPVQFGVKAEATGTKLYKFVASATKEELALLEEILKLGSREHYKVFKQVFKDQRTILRSLRPYYDLHRHVHKDFEKKAYYPGAENSMMTWDDARAFQQFDDDLSRQFGDVVEDHMWVKSNDVFIDPKTNKVYTPGDMEDLVNFYESMAKQGADLSENMAKLRIEIEEELRNFYVIKEDGTRVFYMGP